MTIFSYTSKYTGKLLKPLKQLDDQIRKVEKWGVDNLSYLKDAAPIQIGPWRFRYMVTFTNEETRTTMYVLLRSEVPPNAYPEVHVKGIYLTEWVEDTLLEFIDKLNSELANEPVTDS